MCEEKKKAQHHSATARVPVFLPSPHSPPAGLSSQTRDNPREIGEMKPLPPAGSPDRRGKSPSLLSPSSSSAFPAAADGDHDAAVSEHACVRTPVTRPMLLLLGRVSILFLFFSPSSFPLYWLRRVCPDAIWCSARVWWPAFRVSR